MEKPPARIGESFMAVDYMDLHILEPDAIIGIHRHRDNQEGFLVMGGKALMVMGDWATKRGPAASLRNPDDEDWRHQPGKGRSDARAVNCLDERCCCSCSAATIEDKAMALPKSTSRPRHRWAPIHRRWRDLSVWAPPPGGPCRRRDRRTRIGTERANALAARDNGHWFGFVTAPASGEVSVPCDGRRGFGLFARPVCPGTDRTPPYPGSNCVIREPSPIPGTTRDGRRQPSTT